VPAGRRAASRKGLVVHRVARLEPDRVGGLPVTDLDRALVDTWGLAHGKGGRARDVELARAGVITALRDRRLTADQLRAHVSARPALPGRRQLGDLVDLVEGGCHSELEIWGVRDVLRGPGMPRFVQQHPVVLPFATVHLDAALPDLKIAIELDGAAFHGSAEDRERDTRRDVALAALGWVVLRFSYRRLTTEPEACRREILRVCAARRAFLVRR
jgi:very-short-patch-repair endonuclease